MSEINIQDISKAIDDILTEYLHSSFDVRQKAVQAGAESIPTCDTSAIQGLQRAK